MIFSSVFKPVKILGLVAALIFAGCPIVPLHARDKVTVEYLESQIAKASARGKEKKKADLLYQLGETYFAAGKYQKARGAIKEALAIEDRLGGAGVDPEAKFIPRVHMRVALAGVLIKLNRLEDAIVLYKEAVSILESLNKSAEASKLACHLGNIEIKRNHVDEAKKYFEKALAIADKAGAAESKVTALIGLATIDRISKDNVKALKKLVEAKNLGNLELDGIAYGRLLNELARTYSDMALYDKAVESYKEAAKEFESYGELVIKADTLTSLGEVYLASQDNEKAFAVLNEAYEILKAENDQRALAKNLLPYGSALASRGKFDQALKCHQLAQKIAKKTGNPNIAIQAILEEGYDYFLEGDLEKAIKRSLKASSFVEKYKGAVSPQLRAAIARDCGMGFRALGQVEAAIKHYNDASEYYGKAGKLVDQAGMYESIAVAFLDSGDNEKFKLYHQKAQEVFEEASPRPVDGDNVSEVASSKLKRARGVFNYNYGQYQLFQGKYADAITYFEKSLQDYRSVSDQLGHCHALRGLGLTYLLIGQVGKSKDCYEEASVIASRIGNIESQWDCATGLGKAYKKLGERGKAEVQLKKAVGLADQERRKFTRDTFKTLQLNLREDCFLELVSLLVEEGKFKQALTVAESGRARAFLDMLEGRSQRSSISKQVAMVSSDLLDDSKESKSKPMMIAMAPSSKGPSGFRSVTVKPKSSTLVKPSAISPLYARAPDGEELKSLVRDNGSYFVEYITTADSVIVWVIDSSGELVATKTIKQDLEALKALIKSTYMSIVATPAGMDQLHKLNEKRKQDLNKLYSVLIKPVEDKLPDDPEKVVTIIPYGPLYLVPFAALMSSDNRFFVEKHTIAYLPSIGTLRATSRLRKDVAPADASLLAFGNPIIKANEFLGKLPYSKEEVEKVASLFEGKKVKIEIGEKATKANFRNLAPHFSYLHLATHGLINPDSPMDSSVVLAPEGDDDGLLTVKDILQLPQLKAKLIVLSACQTGKGKVTGDGVIGLSRAFVIAGTPSVMVSQWNVDDVMTQYQMTLMYKELLSGKQKAHSLREAQLKTIAFMEKGLSSSFDEDDSDKPAKVRANPRYWAAFQVIGEYN